MQRTTTTTTTKSKDKGRVDKRVRLYVWSKERVQRAKDDDYSDKTRLVIGHLLFRVHNIIRSAKWSS